MVSFDFGSRLQAMAGSRCGGLGNGKNRNLPPPARALNRVASRRQVGWAFRRLEAIRERERARLSTDTGGQEWLAEHGRWAFVALAANGTATKAQLQKLLNATSSVAIAPSEIRACWV